MRKYFIGFFVILTIAISCKNNSVKDNNIDKKQEKQKVVTENKQVKYTPLIKQNSDTSNYKTEYYKTGEKKSQGIMINGKREGHWVYWFINGKIWSEGNFVDGKSNGKFTVYKNTGEKFVESFYVKGKKYKDIYYKDGKVYREVKIDTTK